MRYCNVIHSSGLILKLNQFLDNLLYQLVIHIYYMSVMYQLWLLTGSHIQRYHQELPGNIRTPERHLFAPV
jgi:hypothetical protein